MRPPGLWLALAAALAAAGALHAAAPALLLWARMPAAAGRGAAASMAAHQAEEAIDGDRRLGPAFGLYPRGCRWREVTNASASDQARRGARRRADAARRMRAARALPHRIRTPGGASEQRARPCCTPSPTSSCTPTATPRQPQADYLYWDFHAKAWAPHRPRACILHSTPMPGPPGWGFLNGTPRSEVRPYKTHVVYRNLWYNDGRCMWLHAPRHGAHGARNGVGSHARRMALHTRHARAWRSLAWAARTAFVPHALRAHTLPPFPMPPSAHPCPHHCCRWYALVDGAKHVPSWRFSRNQVRHAPPALLPQPECYAPSSARVPSPTLRPPLHSRQKAVGGAQRVMARLVTCRLHGPPRLQVTRMQPPAHPTAGPQEITTLHVADAAAFAASVRWRAVPGDTLLFDYIYFTHPTAIGHWWEMVAPLYR